MSRERRISGRAREIVESCVQDPAQTVDHIFLGWLWQDVLDLERENRALAEALSVQMGEDGHLKYCELLRRATTGGFACCGLCVIARDALAGATEKGERL